MSKRQKEFTKELAVECILCVQMCKTAREIGDADVSEVYREVGKTLSLAGRALTIGGDYETIRTKVSEVSKVLRTAESMAPEGSGVREVCGLLASDIDKLCDA